MAVSNMFPARLEELTAPWLTEVLREAGCLAGGTVVKSLDAERIGEGAGFIGEIARLRLSYDQDAPNAPATLIAKFPSPDAGARTVAKLYGLYEREVRFYSEIAGRAGIGTARCYCSAMDVDAGNHLLLLEDLAASGRIGDQVRGCSADDAMLAVTELAKFHASWWESPLLDQIGWLQPGTELVKAAMQYAYPQAWRRCLQTFSDLIAPEIAAAMETLGDRMIALSERFEDRPLTMIHGDYRLDNMFFGGDGASYKIALVDWQSPSRGWGAYDLAYFVSGSMPPEQRRAQERQLVERYREVLLEGGVPSCPLEQLLEDYRASLLVALGIGVVNGATLTMSNQRAVELFRAAFDRLVAAITDLEALDLLPT